jgi:hypothetical protein
MPPKGSALFFRGKDDFLSSAGYAGSPELTLFAEMCDDGPMTTQGSFSFSSETEVGLRRQN